MSTENYADKLVQFVFGNQIGVNTLPDGSDTKRIRWIFNRILKKANNCKFQVVTFIKINLEKIQKG